MYHEKNIVHNEPLLENSKGHDSNIWNFSSHI